MTKYLFFILLVLLSRLLPHPDNFTAVGAVALAGGYYFPKRIGLILPILIMIISDLFLGFHSTVFFVYGSFLLITLLGQQIKKNLNIRNVFAASIASSLLFFIITNFGVWLMGNMYPKNWEGLVQCYYMAVPFFRNTLLGDLFYNGIFYGSINFLQNPIINFLVPKQRP